MENAPLTLDREKEGMPYMSIRSATDLRTVGEMLLCGDIKKRGKKHIVVVTVVYMSLHHMECNVM